MARNIFASVVAIVLVCSSGAPAALVGYYQFESANLGQASVGQDLLAVSSPAADAAGRFGSALTLNGSNQALAVNNGSGGISETAVPAGFPTGNSPYTISLWIKTDSWANSVSSQQGMIGWGAYGSGGRVNAFRLNNANGMVNYWWGRDLSVNPGPVTDSQWHHVLTTYDGSIRSIYVDGVLKGSDPTPPAAPDVTAANFRIGRTNGNEFFKGSLDEVAVFNSGVSASQVYALANGVSPTALPAAANTVSLWTAASGNWNAGANWSTNPAVPTAGYDAYVNNGGTATVASGMTANPSTLVVGGLGAGSVSVTGGTLSAPSIIVSTGGTLTAASGVVSGSITVNSSGTLRLGGSNVLGTGTAISLNGGTFDLQTHRDYFASLTMSNNAQVIGTGWFILNDPSGNVTAVGGGNAGTIAAPMAIASQWGANAGARTQTFEVAAATTLTASGAIANYREGTPQTGSLRKTGDGTLVLTGINTYTGLTTVDGGTLRIAPSASNQPNTFTGGIVVNNGGTLALGRQDIWTNAAGYPAQVITVNAGGQLTSNGFFNMLNNPVLNGGTLSANGGNSSSWGAFGLEGTVTVGGTSPSAISTTGAGSYNFIDLGNQNNAAATIFNVSDATGNAAADLTISIPLVNSGNNASNHRGLIKTGLGTMLLAAANTYSGPTNVDGGTLALAGAGSSSAGRVINVNDGGTLRTDRTDMWGNAPITVSPVLTVNAGGTLASNNCYNTFVNPTLAGGTVITNGGKDAGWHAFGFKGTVTVTGTTPSIILAGATGNAYKGINIGGNNAGFTGNLTFDVADVTSNPAADLTVGAPLINGANGAGGIIGGLIKTGPGTMVLDAANMYTGPTAVDAGTLLVNGSVTSNVTVSGAATLGGRGTVGSLNVLAGGHVAPGTSPGTLSTGDLDLAAGAIFDVELTPVLWDMLDVTGRVNVAGAILKPIVTGSFASYGGSQYMIIQNDLDDDVEGVFAGLDEGARFEAGGAQFAITYVGGTGNDVVLTAVPEPASLGLLLAGAAGLGGYLRRRRR